MLRPKAIAFVNFVALGHRVGDAQGTPRVWDVMLAYEPGNYTEGDLSAQQQFAAEKSGGPRKLLSALCCLVSCPHWKSPR